MCLTIDTNYHVRGRKSGALVAKGPILVYKRLSHSDSTGGNAPYMGTRWTFGTKKTARFSYEGANYSVEAGLHAFYRKDSGRARYSQNELFPAVIPEGAKFYLAADGEIVSTELTVYRNDAECLAAFGVEAFGAPVSRDNYKAQR